MIRLLQRIREIALKALGHFTEVERAAGDESAFRFYDGGALVEMPISRLARSVAKELVR